MFSGSYCFAAGTLMLSIRGVACNVFCSYFVIYLQLFFPLRIPAAASSPPRSWNVVLFLHFSKEIKGE